MKNPVEYAEKMCKGPPKRKEAFTADEVRYLMENLPEDKIGWSIRLMLGTGMRTQELLGLEPRHIAKDGSSITIEQALGVSVETIQSIVGHAELPSCAGKYPAGGCRKVQRSLLKQG